MKKITYISDTHGQHSKLVLPENIDILIHCGDISSRGIEREIIDFIAWFNNAPAKNKVLIAGNHDFLLEQVEDNWVHEKLKENVHYLNDSGVTIDNIKIWGSPVQPWFHNWAFNRQRGAEIKKHWDLIPSDTDILITHGPPFRVLDKTTQGLNVGCEDLMKKIIEINPKYHAFGHIHEEWGIMWSPFAMQTSFINASVLDESYRLVNEPITIDYEKNLQTTEE